MLRREQLLRVDRRDSLQLLCRLLCSAAQAQQSHPQRPPGGRMMMVRRTCELELRCRHDALLPRSMGRTRLPRAAATAQAPPACATSLNPAYRPCPPPPCRPVSQSRAPSRLTYNRLCKVEKLFVCSKRTDFVPQFSSEKSRCGTSGCQKGVQAQPQGREDGRRAQRGGPDGGLAMLGQNQRVRCGGGTQCGAARGARRRSPAACLFAPGAKT